MKIQRKKNNILYSTNSARVLVCFQIEKIDREGIDIIINKTCDILNIEDVFQIDSCGEFEDKDVMVQAISSINNDKIDIISIDNNGINLVIVDSKTQIPKKKILEQIGINNVLVFKETDGIGNIFDLIDNFSPQYIIPITDNISILEEIYKKLSVLPEEKVKNFSLTQEELPSDEEGQPLSLIILE